MIQIIAEVQFTKNHFMKLEIIRNKVDSQMMVVSKILQVKKNLKNK